MVEEIEAIEGGGGRFSDRARRICRGVPGIADVYDGGELRVSRVVWGVVQVNIWRSGVEMRMRKGHRVVYERLEGGAASGDRSGGDVV